MFEKALMLNGWFERHRRTLTIAGWLCFAVVCADYARFINLPTIVAVPFWVGVAANVLRWGIWEGLLKGRLEAAMLERANTGPVPVDRDGLPPTADG